MTESRNRFFFRPFNPFSRVKRGEKGKKRRRRNSLGFTSPWITRRDIPRERERKRERGLCFNWITSVATWLHPRFTPFGWTLSLPLSLSPLLASCNVWNVRPTSLRRERSLAKLSVEKFATSSCTRRHHRCHTISFYIGFGKIGTDFHDIVTNLNIDLSNNFVSNNFLAYWSKHALRASYFE